MKIWHAQCIARRLLEELTPLCWRLEVAGSIRRGKEDVTDIELVAVPKWETVVTQSALFEEETKSNLVYQWAKNKAANNGVQWVYKRHGVVYNSTIIEDAKMLKGLLPDGTQLDLFLPESLDNFGLIYLIRTGSAQFSQEMVTHAKRIGWGSKGGWLHNPQGERVNTPNEKDVFRVLGLQYIQPEHRIDGSAVMQSCGAEKEVIEQRHHDPTKCYWCRNRTN